MRNKQSILRITYTAIFSAIIMLFTALVKFSTGLGEGYIHLGDSVIYLCACVLPFPYCIIAAALGGALADVLAGFAIWSVPTAIIKALITIPFALVVKNNSSKILNKKTAFMPVVAGIISIGGYFVAECVLYSVASATLSILGNVIQAVGSAVIFYIMAIALDKTNFKRRINNG